MGVRTPPAQLNAVTLWLSQVGIELSQIGSSPAVALVVGSIFGFGAQRLSGTVGKRVGDLFVSTTT